jgi:Protein of unknown function (DUF3455)
MTHIFARTVAIGALILGFGSSIYAQNGVPFGPDLPAIPGNLVVDEGFSLFFQAHAIGTQNYLCAPATTGFAWRQIEPQATLFQTFRDDLNQQLATHFLSANPDEDGVARATWQHSFDSSRVWARMLRFSTDSNFVQPGAIPWFLLVMVGKADGPTGGGMLAQTAYIQRLNTSGGAAPSTGCATASDVGAFVIVPYSADYFFYRKNHDQ